MQILEYPGPCFYCGKPIGVIMPYSREGVLIIKNRKLRGVAHWKCDKAATESEKHPR